MMIARRAQASKVNDMNLIEMLLPVLAVGLYVLCRRLKSFSISLNFAEEKESALAGAEPSLLPLARAAKTSQRRLSGAKRGRLPEG